MKKILLLAILTGLVGNAHAAGFEDLGLSATILKTQPPTDSAKAAEPEPAKIAPVVEIFSRTGTDPQIYSVPGSTLAAEIDRLVLPLIENKEKVGFIVGIISRSGKRIFSYGKTELGGTAAPDENTIFEIGSITKVFTTTLLAGMANRNRVGLDDPIDGYLPQGMTAPQFPGRKIRLSDLATHTSGLPPLPTNMDTSGLNPYAGYNINLLTAFLKDYELTAPPGESYSYSNLGVGLLGHILENIEKNRYENLVKQNITQPLHMDDTSIMLTSDQSNRAAKGYLYEKGQLTEVPYWDFNALYGCGALRSSLKDMLIFLEANLNPGGTPVGEALRLAHITRKDLWENWSIALGWHVRPLDKIIWHNGATYGAMSYIGFIEEKRIGVVFLTNTYAPDFDTIDLGEKLLRVIEKSESR